MGRKGFTLVEIMIVVGIVALLAAIVVPNMLTAKRTANEAAAKATIRSLSTAAETFAIPHGGAYPTTVAELNNFIASASNYCSDVVVTAVTPVQGYNYGCGLAVDGYTFVATPITLGTTGSVTYTVTTGGVLTP